MPHEPALSVIIPSYNERSRLPQFLAQVREYLDSCYPLDYEVIVVDDGSNDDTLGVLESLLIDWSGLVIARHLENLGKGAAVKTGMALARGRSRLFVDADGATPIVEEARLRQALKDGADVAVGSRAFTDERGECQRAPLRQTASWIFGRLARCALRIGVQDTQCGFKLFRREAAQCLFANLNEAGFAFDLELLVLARQAAYRIVEVPVMWREVPGSKVRIVRDSWRMIKSLVAIRRRMRRFNALNDKRAALRRTAPREVVTR